jgi:hypothetical protein
MQEKSVLSPIGNPFVKNKFKCPEPDPAVQFPDFGAKHESQAGAED